jgi:hypothetical protein
MKAAILLVAALAGCASLPASIHATPEELSACAAATDGCSVWTTEELMGYTDFIVRKVIEDIKSRGRSL